jgi:hypothetical protein
MTSFAVFVMIHPTAFAMFITGLTVFAFLLSLSLQGFRTLWHGLLHINFRRQEEQEWIETLKDRIEEQPDRRDIWLQKLEETQKRLSIVNKED